MLEVLETIITVAVLAVAAVATLRDHLSTDPDPITDLKARYAAGEIDATDFDS